MSRFAVKSYKRCLPQLEVLENRWCPSAPGIVQTGHTLSITGDGANDIIRISDNGQGGVMASITLANSSQKVSATGITDIKIESGAGNDTISYALTSTLKQNQSLMLCLDKGSNQAFLDYSAGLQHSDLAIAVGAAGNDQLTTQFGAMTGSRLNLSECLGASPVTSHVNFGALSSSLATVCVNSSSGSDHLFAQVGNANNSNLQFLTQLGKGADSFNLQASCNLVNSVVHFDIDAGSGADAITFNAQDVNVDSTSRFNLESCTGAGNDTVTMTYSGVMNGELDVNLQGGTGDNTMQTALTLDPGSMGRLHGNLHGGAGNDDMTFDVFNNSNPGGKSTLALLQALLDGGAGDNTLSATPNVKVIQ
jgi:hypothetical protein